MIKGPRFKIPTLPQVGEALNAIVEWVESLPRSPKINGGPNIKITQDQESVTITGSAQGVGGVSAPALDPCAWSFAATPVSTTEKNIGGVLTQVTTANLYNTGGSINGTFANNFENIGNVESDQKYYLYLAGDATATGINDVNFFLSQKLVPLTTTFTEWRPPPNFRLLIGIVENNSVNPMYCESIIVKPDIAYIDEQASPPKPYYFWNIQ